MQIIKNPSWPRTELKIGEWPCIIKGEKEGEQGTGRWKGEIETNPLRPIMAREIEKFPEIPKSTQMNDRTGSKGIF